MYENPYISFDKFKDLIIDILETSMGDIDRDTSNFIYHTDYGKYLDDWKLMDCGLDNIKSFEELYDYIVFKKNTRNIYVIADTHFNHERIIEYCNRPYKSVNEMNNDIIKRWNSVVKPTDIVLHLGDFGFGTQIELSKIFNRLNGIKYLIMGNHDYKVGKKYYEEIGFTKVYKEYTVDNLVFSHHPKDVNYGQINIYGHIHNAKPDKKYNDKNHACVSVEKINYTPIKLIDILKDITHE